MPLPNIFNKTEVEKIINRINQLSPTTQAQWGTMSVDKMLAHCNVTYEMLYDEKYPKPNAFIRFILKTFVKNKVVSETLYGKNGKTAPEFIIKEAKNFDAEKARLIEFINKTQALGQDYFEGKESHSFGVLNKTEWNNLFYKHLNHHLTQFGV
jgi:hypothetical protein